MGNMFSRRNNSLLPPVRQFEWAADMYSGIFNGNGEHLLNNENLHKIEFSMYMS